MFSRSKRLIFSIILGVSVLNSCVEEITDDIDDLKTGDDTQSWIFPLINSDIQVTDFDSVDLKVRADGTVYYTSQVDSIVVINPDSIFTLAPQRVFNTSFKFDSVNTVPYSNPAIRTLEQIFQQNPLIWATVAPLDGLTFSVPPLAPAAFGNNLIPPFTEFDFIDYESGNINVEISNNTNIPLNEVRLRVNNTVTGAQLGIVYFPTVDSMSSETQQINVSGVTLNKNVDFDIITLGSPGTATPIDIDFDQVIAVTVSSSPDMVVNSANAQFPVPMFQKDIQYPITDAAGNPLNEELTEILFKEGTLQYVISSQLSTSITLDGEVLGASPNKDFTDNFPITPGFTNNGDIDLAGTEVPLDQYPGQPYNNLTVRLKPQQFFAATNVAFDKNDEFQVTLLLRDAEFKHVIGRFKEKSFNLTPTNLNWSDDIFSHVYGNIEIEDAKLHIQSNTNIGVEFGADIFGFVTNYDEATLQVELNERAILEGSEGPAFTPKYDEFTYHNMNSNSDEIVSFLPYKMTSAGTMSINSADPNRLCYINDEAYGVFDLEFETPLHLWADTLFYRDTLVYDNSDFDDLEDIDTTKFLNSVFLHMYVTNDIPLNIEALVHFADSINPTTDTLLATVPYDNVIQGASVDAAGNKVEATKYEKVIELTKEQRRSLIDGDKIVVEAAIVTSQNNGNSPFVRIKNTDSFKLNLSVEVNNYIPVE